MSLFGENVAEEKADREEHRVRVGMWQTDPKASFEPLDQTILKAWVIIKKKLNNRVNCLILLTYF